MSFCRRCVFFSSWVAGRRQTPTRFPRIGSGPESIEFERADLTPPSEGAPLALDGPLHPAYREAE